jgi:hypothetical protein
VLGQTRLGEWLLIIDNVDDVDIVFESFGQQGSIYDHFPNNYEGRILFTTRSPKVATSVAGNNAVELREMTEEEARNLLPGEISAPARPPREQRSY